MSKNLKSFLIYVGVSCLIGLCYFFVIQYDFFVQGDDPRIFQPHWLLFLLILACGFAVLMLWIYPVFLASRRSLRHAGLALAIASFGFGVLWSMWRC